MKIKILGCVELLKKSRLTENNKYLKYKTCRVIFNIHIMARFCGKEVEVVKEECDDGYGPLYRTNVCTFRDWMIEKRRGMELE